MTLSFRDELDNDLPAALANKTLHVDPNKFAVVIRNLVSNALKFTPKGGVVTVSLAIHPYPPQELPTIMPSSDLVRVHPETRCPVCLLRLVVTDTGAGISQVRCFLP